MPWKRPTLDTPFHIDWEWWRENESNYRFYLYEQLCDLCRERFRMDEDTQAVDWIDPDTAEVTEDADAWLICLMKYCADDPGYISSELPLAAAIFRVFLTNGNKPLTPRQLHERVPWRDERTILRVIGGRKIHYGIRPVID
ncbi:MAG TPA: hypothetical protein EYP25_08875 [Anaerolineae bacterium]|nr:hypothetical protein [Anaerolineae bacterium]HIQ11872.1 hypothetical protein [Caldilineales bacterium]